MKWGALGMHREGEAIPRASLLSFVLYHRSEYTRFGFILTVLDRFRVVFRRNRAGKWRVHSGTRPE